MKGVMRFGKSQKIFRYVGSSKIVKRVGSVSYEFKWQNEFSLINPIFHVSMLKKCICDPVSILPLEILGVKEDLHYEEVSVVISVSKLVN